MSTAAATALPTRAELQDRVRRALDAVGARVELAEPGVHGQQASTPLTGEILFTVAETTTAQTAAAITEAAQAFSQWRRTPAPVRGQLVARLGELLRVHKADLADLVTIEAGKITSEALGEVQEMIDICDFAVGLSRQLYGRTIASERPGHRLMETWHPLGVVGVITAFNFPVAVWAWNSAVALVCGDTVVWKPSELTPLTAVACQALIERAAADVGAPAAVSRLVLGGREVGELLVDDPRVALVSATGTFWDTVVVCALTGLVVVNSGGWQQGLSGSALTNFAFGDLPVVGPIVLTIGLLTFVFSTILGWAFYGEKAAEYLFGSGVIVPYRVLWVVAVFVGSVSTLTAVWSFSDVANGLMAVPNLISLLALNGVIVKETAEYLWSGNLDKSSGH